LLKSQGYIANDGLVLQTRAATAKALEDELLTPKGLADLLPVIPTYLQDQKLPLADADDPKASDINAETFLLHLKELGESSCTAYGHALHLRALARIFKARPTIISINGEGLVTGVFEPECEEAGSDWQRAYLVNVLAGEPNEHYAALIPSHDQHKPKPAQGKSPLPAQTSSAPPRPPPPPSRKKKGGASFEAAFKEFPWLRQVENTAGKSLYYTCF
jgi:hypothetical protein